VRSADDGRWKKPASASARSSRLRLYCVLRVRTQLRQVRLMEECSVPATEKRGLKVVVLLLLLSLLLLLLLLLFVAVVGVSREVEEGLVLLVFFFLLLLILKGEVVGW
jgi:hypothetical protein